jgi:uncharacterized protein YjiK
MKLCNKILFFALSILFVSCSKSGNDGPAPEKEYEEFSTLVPGFSGLCFNADKTSFFAVSDNSGIYELYKDGDIKRKLPYTGTNDFEAITINPANGRLYIADESLMNVYLLSTDEQSLTLVSHVSVPGGVSNKGIEGLSYGSDTLYIANQESPTLLIKYSLSSQSESSRRQVNFAYYLSDVFFDNTDNTLWICDSQQKMIFHCTLNGDVIASQEINYVQKAEAIVIDRPTNTAWVGCDQTSKLYKIKLKI